MTNLFTRFLLFSLLTTAMLLPARFCQAQTNDTSYTTIDTTYIEEEEEEDYIPSTEDEENEDEESNTEILPIVRTVSADSINAFKRSSDFAYMTSLDSLLRARQKEKDNIPEEKIVVEEKPSIWDSGIVKFICWAVAISLVGFVLYRLFLGGGVFFSNKKQELPTVQLEDTPDETDLEKALQQAIKKQDYRMATRYLFLITLNRLGEKGVLQLSTEKTNYQYTTELSGKPYANRFAKLSLQYEYVWFGGFAINQSQFTTLQQQHQQFLKEI
jgi:hypothetical protein